MSTIYWKFKNTKSEFSSITFDSTHVSILDLKRAIIKQKKLQQTPQQPFDLSIINAHTGVEYTDETGPIPRNLAVIVRRLPAARNQHKKLWAPLQNNSIIATADNISKKQIQTISERLNTEFGPALFNDPSSASGVATSEVNAVETETMNIIDMMNRRMNNGTTTVIDGGRNGGMMRNRMNNRHHHHHNNMNGGMNKDGKQSYRSQRGDPPPGYICHRCHVSGHWIQDCPTNGDPKFDKKNRASTLRSQLPVPKPAAPTNISGDTTTTNVPTQQVIVGRKCYQIPANVYELMNGDHSKIKAYIEISSGKVTNGFSQNSSQGNAVPISRYMCEICQSYYVDARFTPCCRVTYCNECIRQKSLFECPSMIKCPSCEQIFSSEALDTTQNTRLQDKVNKIVAQQKQQKAKMNLSSTDIPTTTTTSINTQKTPKTIHIPTPHTITIPQPQMMGHNISAKIRPTVILQQSPPSTVYKPVTTASITVPTPTMQNASNPPPPPVQPVLPSAPVITPIDTTGFEAPKNTIPTNNMNYVCIECNQRGHKYKDCPQVAEKKMQKSDENNNNSETIKNGGNKSDKSDINTIQSLKDDGLDRIPKKTASDITPPTQKNVNISVNKANTIINTPQNVINTNLMTLNQQRISPQVQLINNSAASALSTLTAINSVNMMNMRNRMNLNNILMNAALHNAQRRTGGVAPRLINSTNPLLNPALALNRMSNARNGTLALLQQQSLLTQQAAFNRLRTLNNFNQLNTQTQTNPNINNFSLANIPQELLQSTIHELKQVMASSDPSAVTKAINNAFVKLGANDPDSKRLVLQQLVATISNVSANQKNSVTANPAAVASNANAHLVSANNMSGNANNNDMIGGVSNSTSKKSKKKHKKSKSKKSKKKHKKSKSSKERKHKHKRRKERERERRDRDKKDRSRSRDRGRSQNESENDEFTNSDFQENDQNENEDTVIHVVDVQTLSSKKRKLPPAPMPDFTISPPPSPPKHKRQKTSNSNSPPIK